MESWSSTWTSLSEDNLKGFVSTVEEAESVRRAFEVHKSLSFVSRKKDAQFGKHDYDPKKSRIRFQDIRNEVIPYCGLPFIICARYERECVYGIDKHKRAKDRYKRKAEEELKSDHPVPGKRKKLLQRSKKKDCKAKIVMKEVLIFPDYKVPQNTEKARRCVSEKLRDDLDDPAFNVRKERRIYITLPDDNQHEDKHLLGQLTGFMNPLSKDVRDKLVELVGHGVTSVAEMRRHLRVFVDTSIFFDKTKPASSDAAYYPTDETIRKHIYKAQLRLRYSKLDQENLIQQTAEWQQNFPDDNFSFMPASPATTSLGDEDIKVECVEQDDDDEVYPQLVLQTEATEFFFCHQTKFQRHLLYRYGNSLCLLDATYRTTKYALPLFFLAVKTNVGFSVVGEFVVQHETKNSIMKGLKTFQEWINEASDKPTDWTWEPKFFMTDFCEREIVAIEEVFPESFVYICDFHREQSWTRWVSKIDNGVSQYKEVILSMLRRCAHACTLTEYQDAIQKLQASSFWLSNSRLRNWITKTWLNEEKRWVWAHRYGKGLPVNTNNGLERQNKIFKYQFLEQRKNHNLSGMISTLLQEYLPTMMLKYIRDNATSTDFLGRTYDAEVPCYLQNRPAQFIKHCLSKIELSEAITGKDIKPIGDRLFQVLSQSGVEKTSYTVNLDCGNGMPSCDCHNWTWALLPCKHMFAVFAHSTCSWEDLAAEYRRSPFFNIDDIIVKHPVTNTTLDDTLHEESGFGGTPSKGFSESAASLEDLPVAKKTPRSLKSLAIKCREKLSLLQNATYLCQSEEMLTSLIDVLDNEIIKINDNLYIDHGLCEETPPKQTEEKSKPKRIHSKLKLVKSRKRKERTTGKKPSETPRKRKERPTETKRPEKYETIIIDDIMYEDATVENKPFEDSTAADIKTVDSQLKKRKIEKHVSWSDDLLSFSNNNSTAVTSSDIDQQKAQNHVDRIWDQREESNYILAKVYGFNITDVDIKSLKSSQWLTDQVMDGYLAFLAQKELDKGIKVKHEVVSTMTNIINDNHVMKKKCRVLEYDYIFGAYHQRGGHWDVVVVEPKRGAVFFYNPLGESASQQRRAINSWRNYVKRHMPLNTGTSWHLESQAHTLQLDSCNCGVYCLMFVERHLAGKSLLNISLADIEAKRKEIGCTFLLFEVYMKKQCPSCGFHTSNEKETNLLQCRKCERFFHKKNHCVGELIAKSNKRSFLCKVCT